MTSPQPMALEDRYAADVFRKSYRRYLELKPTHYRWSHLAPQSVGHLQEAVDRHWSVEKLADYLHCQPDEAAACLKRYIMSKKTNAKPTTAARLRQAVSEWIGGVAEVDEKTRERMADELARMVGNQLFLAARAKEDLAALSRELEGEESGSAPASPPAPAGDPPPKWGPQWKD
jgi:hypothetical protein